MKVIIADIMKNATNMEDMANTRVVNVINRTDRSEQRGRAEKHVPFFAIFPSLFPFQ